jgi:hypothetical protein
VHLERCILRLLEEFVGKSTENLTVRKMKEKGEITDLNVKLEHLPAFDFDKLPIEYRPTVS